MPNCRLHLQLPHPVQRLLCRLLLCSKRLCCLQEYTNYHFDVAGEALQGALEREVMAVDSEFSGEPPVEHRISGAAAHRCSR